MSEFLRSWLTAAIFVAVAVALTSGFLGLSSLLRPHRPTAQKVIAYESGVDPVGEGWSQSQIRYYIFALLFVVFDVEAIFIFPWAVSYGGLGLFALIEMAIFVAILLLGYLYAWRKRALEWT